MNNLYPTASLLCILALGGCVSISNDNASSASPEQPWSPVAQTRLQADTEPAETSGIAIDSSLDFLAEVEGLGDLPPPGLIEAFSPSESPMPSAGSAPAGRLSPANVVGLALQQSPRSRIAWYHARAQATRLAQSRSAYFPRINFSAEVGRSHSEGQLPKETVTHLGPSLQLSWLLYDFGNREATVEAAQAALTQANLSHHEALQLLARDALVAYYELAGAQAARQADDVALALARTSLEAAQRRSASGLGTRPDVLRAEAELRSIEARRESSTASVEAARAALARTLGLTDVAAVEIVGFAESTSSDPTQAASAEVSRALEASVGALVARALQERPGLRANAAEVQAAQAAVRQARTSVAPQLRFESGANWRSFADDALADQDDFRAALVLEWTLFDGFRRRHEILESREQLRAAEEAMRQAELEAVAEVWEAYFAWQAAQRRVTANAAAVAAREEAYRAFDTGYRSGRNSFLELLTAQQDLAESRRDLAQAQADIGRHQALLAYAVGQM